MAGGGGDCIGSVPLYENSQGGLALDRKKRLIGLRSKGRSLLIYL